MPDEMAVKKVYNTEQADSQNHIEGDMPGPGAKRIPLLAAEPDSVAYGQGIIVKQVKHGML